MVRLEEVWRSVLSVFRKGHVAESDEVAAWFNELVHLLAPVGAQGGGDCDEEAGERQVVVN